MKHFLFAVLFLNIGFSICAQETVRGRVVDSENSRPLEDVTVLDVVTNKWTITDKNGYFQLQENIQSGVTLKFSLLGKQERTIEFSRNELTQELRVVLNNQDLRLQEVVLVARKGKEQSEIVLSQEAINQVQAFSLNEVLEQLPGQAITNFNLSEFKPIAFRTVKPSFVSDAAFGNKSFGTAIVVDDIPISNNENMQSYGGNSGAPFQPNYLGFGDAKAFGFNGYFSNANYGADLREIPTENIEKIEVVQGIPSAKYGDLTSGLIKIEQKAGQSPFRVYTSLRDGATEFGLNKGFKINDRAGNLNLSMNYVESNANPRLSFTRYKRITTNAMWSWNNTLKTIRNSFSFNYGFNDDHVNYEEEDEDDKRVINKKKDFSFANRFKWRLDKPLFDNVNVNINFKYADHYTFESKLINSGGAVVGNSIEEGVYEGIYTPVSYTTVKAIEGIPISGFFEIDFNKTIVTQKSWAHNFAYGTSFRLSDNKGRGRLGSPETINSSFSNTVGNGSAGFRPYNYGENIQAEYQFSVYAEDNIIKRWENSKFNMTPGLRYDLQSGFSILNPRLNSYYSFNQFKIRGGLGLTSKAPSLNQIYTGPRYYDIVLGDYRLPGVYNIGIVQTFIDQADNKDLKPSRSFRSEIGLDYVKPFGKLNITAFYNRLYDGITNTNYPLRKDLAEVQVIDNGTIKPDYDITGYAPYYYTQNKIVNNYESDDKGVEVFLSFDRLPFRNLEFDIQGSYIETKSRNNVDSYYKATKAFENEKYGLYEPYDVYSKQFRLGGNLSYHLPEIGLVLSVRSEHFMIQDYQYQQADVPYAYIDANLDKIIIPEADRANKALYGHIIKSSGSYENRALDNVYHNFHVRISKDFLNGFRFSFYANNFLDLKQTEYRLYNGSFIKMQKPDMVELSFGTKIEYQF